MAYASSIDFNSQLNSAQLNQFVETQIQLSRPETESFNEAVDATVRFLQSPSASFPWSIKRVVKSGSLAKGTAVKGFVDIDLVCFMEKSDVLQSPEDFIARRSEIINAITAKLQSNFDKASNWKLISYNKVHD